MSVDHNPQESDDEFRPQAGWLRKFGLAFLGIYRGARGQSSFAVHLLCALAVVVAAAWFGKSLLEWCVLILCITIVLAAELMNSAIEHLGKAIDRRYNPHLAAALDIASGAVLITAIGAALIGAIIFLL